MFKLPLSIDSGGMPLWASLGVQGRQVRIGPDLGPRFVSGSGLCLDSYDFRVVVSDVSILGRGMSNFEGPL